MKSPLLSIQLYSLRNETGIDPVGTVRQVPSLGFDGVELAGDYGLSSGEWRKLLDETGLAIVGAHIGLESMESDLAGHVAFQKALGNARLIVPSLPRTLQTTVGYQGGARRLNDLAAKLKDEGMTLSYHNHDFEFANLEGGTCGMSILIENTDPALVTFEVDTYWVERGGEDAAEFIGRHASRIGMIHAKELRKRDLTDVPAGQGDVDFKTIIPMARKNRWPIVVEYEGGNALEVVSESAGYLRTLL